MRSRRPRRPQRELVLILAALALTGCAQPTAVVTSPAVIVPASLPTVALAPATEVPAPVQTATTPGCSPIAFSLHDAEPSQDRIALICPDGSDFRVVSPDGLSSSGPTWSPDGRQIAFLGEREGAGTHVFTMTADGADLRRRTTEGTDTWVIWEPDGQSLSIQSTDEQGLYWWQSLDLKSGELSHRTEPTFDFFFETQSMSPDGARVAYMSLAEQTQRNDGSSQIHVQNRDGSNDQALTADLWANLSPQWSPDGQHIAYLSEKGYYNVFNLFVMRADGTEARQLTHSLFPEGARLSWSPDGSTIAIGQQLDLAPQILIIDVASGKAHVLYAGGDQPAWSPQPLDPQEP